MTTTVLRTAAWYGDAPLPLRFPDAWDVSVLWPRTPPPLGDAAIAEAVRRPIGRPRISELARGRSRPVIVVDDLTRPTPVERILPAVLDELEDAGVPVARTTILLATGTHGRPDRQAMTKKVGAETAARCRVAAHDDLGATIRVGRTSFGTPVEVDPAVAGSDLVLGIAGIYPQNSTGFGGGSKLALGVLSRRSIKALHYGHSSMRGSYEIDNDFRRDLDEIAELIGLSTIVNVHVDADRRPVRVVCGDPAKFYRDGVAFSRSAYSAPLPADADVVVSNAYPMDVSLTFMRSKGVIPLRHAAPRASRVVVAACPEGIGHHGLYPFMNGPPLPRLRHMARLVAARPREVPVKGVQVLRSRVAAKARGRSAGARPDTPGGERPPAAPPQTLLYAPGAGPGDLPETIPGMRPVYDWEEILRQIDREQAGKARLRAVVYPCAPLQVLDLPRPGHATEARRELEAVD